VNPVIPSLIKSSSLEEESQFEFINGMRRFYDCDDLKLNLHPLEEEKETFEMDLFDTIENEGINLKKSEEKEDQVFLSVSNEFRCFSTQ